MSIQVNRRQWLKTSALAAAGLTLVRCGDTINRLEASAESSPGNDDLIWLDQNENPYGISKNTQNAIVNAIKYSNRYPEKQLHELKDLIAKHENVSPGHIIIGAGSTEVFSIAGLLYSGQAGEVLMADPSYQGFRNYFSRVGGRLNLVPLNNSYEHDLESMYRRISKSIRLVYVCNPNNPTGTVVAGEKLLSFCEEASRSAAVFVDEAYHELVEDSGYASMIDLVRQDRDIIISRTFSKIHGLAGLRVGYGIARPGIIEDFRRIQTNFSPVSVLSLYAAVASYKDAEYIDSSRKKNGESRSYFYSVLEKLEYFYIPSHTNFVIFRIDRDAKDFLKEVRKRNVVLRTFAFNDANWIRVSMGTMQEMRALASVLEEIT